MKNYQVIDRKTYYCADKGFNGTAVNQTGYSFYRGHSKLCWQSL